MGTNRAACACAVLMSMCLLAAAWTDPFEAVRDQEDGVMKLDGSSFDSTLNKCKHSLVEFYAPWCGHCKKIAPEYKKLARHFLKNAKKGEFNDVDASDKEEAGDLAERYGISGFPTIKVFRGGTFSSDYNGERTWKDMAAHMRLLSKAG